MLIFLFYLACSKQLRNLEGKKKTSPVIWNKKIIQYSFDFI